MEGLEEFWIKNKGLLAKWVWRFSKDDGSLWKTIICVKYGIAHNTLLWNWRVPSTASFFTKAVGSLFEEGSRTADVLSKGFKLVLGSGDKIRLWEDAWWDGCLLKLIHPKIFALAVLKSGSIKEFGDWHGDIWVWKIDLRRIIYDWEVNLWNMFLLSLDCIVVRKSVSDDVAWSYCPNGLFSVSLFRRFMEDNRWMGLCPNGKSGRAWGSLFQAIVWSLWEARNLMVFKGSPTDINYVIDLINFRVAWWFKHNGKGSSVPIYVMVENLNDCCTEVKTRKHILNKGWIPHLGNALKFNVDGSV
ncbi:hypothetical protein Ddye_014293 [Dipteronia dyeriana]|uniref:Reverse transcriptase zinc-binding domain-containing protein n=1 Tax=Dipteronia dyeriana TaxID=168575 RepID=A0AAD9X7Y0_9ROSI|nr:hypothetical protein Ddye_014293 [Dipteronia dyeriana]